MALNMFAPVREKAGELRKARHSVGLPSELSGKPQRLLPWPSVVILLHKEHGVMLERYTGDGQFAGDT